MAVLREDSVAARVFKPNPSGQFAHAAPGFHHVLEREEERFVVLGCQHLDQVFGGVFRIAQPFEHIIPVILQTHVS